MWLRPQDVREAEISQFAPEDGRPFVMACNSSNVIGRECDSSSRLPARRWGSYRPTTAGEVGNGNGTNGRCYRTGSRFRKTNPGWGARDSFPAETGEDGEKARVEAADWESGDGEKDDPLYRRHLAAWRSVSPGAPSRAGLSISCLSRGLSESLAGNGSARSTRTGTSGPSRDPTHHRGKRKPSFRIGGPCILRWFTGLGLKGEPD
jgi:hypothetical protein